VAIIATGANRAGRTNWFVPLFFTLPFPPINFYFSEEACRSEIINYRTKRKEARKIELSESRTAQGGEVEFSIFRWLPTTSDDNLYLAETLADEEK